MEELLVLVDDSDEVIGHDTKISVHAEGKLHRAFSVYIVDEVRKKVLIHQRALNKYHSGGLWTNACCSHPRKGEQTCQAVIRRLQEELGLQLSEKDFETGSIKEVGKFKYYKDFEDCAEHEIDHVFVWSVDAANIRLSPDKNEIMKLVWCDYTELMEWMKNSPSDFTVWFFEVFRQCAYECFETTSMGICNIPWELIDIMDGIGEKTNLHRFMASLP